MLLVLLGSDTKCVIDFILNEIITFFSVNVISSKSVLLDSVEFSLSAV